ncbi:MAG TPA: phosphoribosylglycinamide formyltransferase [Sphingomonadaceae bacterium]|nr:phosphoribosylglycinamide formyltransferase [Sphingomonadaceae bacterium]
MIRARVAILISGSGTNMAALIYASRMEDAAFEVVLIASNDPDAGGLAMAEAEGIPTFSLSHKGMSRDLHENSIDEAIRKSGATHVALAGYMRVLGADFVRRWEGRMLNIHPSLLPKYKGLHTHARALEAGDSHAGASVHLVTAELDAGEILGQAKVAILPGDTEDTLAKRVLIAEHQLYSRVLNAYVRREADPNWLAQQVRTHALALPETDEVLSHGMPCFGIAGGKKFAYVSMNHHGDGKTALLVKISGGEEQAMLIERDQDIYYRPSYFGDSWIGIRLDLGDTDWDEVAERLTQSWRWVAPKKLSGLIHAAAEF